MMSRLKSWNMLTESVSKSVKYTLRDIWRGYNEIELGDRDVRSSGNVIKQVQSKIKEKLGGNLKMSNGRTFKPDGDWGETSVLALGKAIGVKFNNLKSVTVGPNTLAKLGFKRPPTYSRDIKVLATTLAIESGPGSKLAEVMAIANIIANRKVARRKASYTELALEPSQFSLWNGFEKDVDGAMKKWRPENRKNWSIAVSVAKKLKNGTLKDNTKGATHYYNSKIVTPPWGKGPYWKDHQLGLIHTFGRDTKTGWAKKPVTRTA